MRNEFDRSDFRMFGWLLWGGIAVTGVAGKSLGFCCHPAFLLLAVAYFLGVIFLFRYRLNGRYSKQEVEMRLLFHPGLLLLIGAAFFIEWQKGK